MSNAYSYLDTRERGPFSHELLDDLAYKDKVFGEIRAKKGFITDYASIGPLRNVFLMFLYMLLVGFGNKPATIHDWLYSGYGIMRPDGALYYPTREECDAIYYRALIADNVGKWRAFIFWTGVRAFGWTRFTDGHKRWE